MRTSTRYIAEAVKRLTALEYDVDLEHILKGELASFEHAEIKMGDVRTVNWTDEAGQAKSAYLLFGNLPYHLSSEIILSLIEHMGAWRRACFMVQKEFEIDSLHQQGIDCRPRSQYNLSDLRTHILFCSMSHQQHSSPAENSVHSLSH